MEENKPAIPEQAAAQAKPGGLNDSVKASGALVMELRDKDGKVKERRELKNLVVTAGKNFIAARLKDTGQPTQMTHMAVGTTNTSPAAGDTALAAEAARVALNTAGGTVSTNTVQYSGTFGAGTGTGALVEAGIFNNGSVGTMLCRTTFSVINKGASDSLTITWTLTIS